MNQTRVESFIEKSIDTLSAFLISWLILKYAIRPNLDIISDSVFVLIFTVVSFIRGYFWRRFFNAGLHKIVHRWVTNVIRA